MACPYGPNAVRPYIAPAESSHTRTRPAVAPWRMWPVTVLPRAPGLEGQDEKQLPAAALRRQNLYAGKALKVLTVEGADSFDAICHHGCDKLQIKDSSAAHGAPAQ